MQFILITINKLKMSQNLVEEVTNPLQAPPEPEYKLEHSLYTTAIKLRNILNHCNEMSTSLNATLNGLKYSDKYLNCDELVELTEKILVSKLIDYETNKKKQLDDKIGHLKLLLNKSDDREV